MLSHFPGDVGRGDGQGLQPSASFNSRLRNALVSVHQNKQREFLWGWNCRDNDSLEASDCPYPALNPFPYSLPRTDPRVAGAIQALDSTCRTLSPLLKSHMGGSGGAGEGVRGDGGWGSRRG